MKSIEIKKFVANVKKFNRANNTLPILDNILIKDQMLIASNLDIIYKVRFPELSPELIGLVDILFLEKIAKKTKDIDLNEIGKIKTNKGTFDYNPEIENAKEFIQTDFKTKNSTGLLKSETIVELKKAVNFISKDELRPIMGGVFVNDKELCATDAHIMYFKDHNSKIKDSFIIPSKVIPLLQETEYSISDSEFTEYSNGVKVKVFKTNNEEVIFIPVDGKYPNYRAVIPTNNPNIITVNKKDFLDGISVAEISANKITSQVIISITKGIVNLKANDLDFGRTYNGILEGANYKGDDMQIGFNSALMTKGLKYLSNDLEIAMSLPHRAIILNKCFLLMPIMDNDY